MQVSCFISLALQVAISAHTGAAVNSPIKFDEFGDISCKEELARLENYSVQLRELSEAIAVVVVYGGRRYTRRGEIAARLFATRDRLTGHDSVSGNRIVLVNGGFREKLTIELWLIPSIARSSAKFLANPSVESEEVRLKKSVVNEWKYPCQRN